MKNLWIISLVFVLVITNTAFAMAQPASINKVLSVTVYIDDDGDGYADRRFGNGIKVHVYTVPNNRLIDAWPTNSRSNTFFILPTGLYRVEVKNKIFFVNLSRDKNVFVTIAGGEFQ